MAQQKERDLFLTMSAVDAVDWLLDQYPIEVEAIIRKESGSDPDIMTRDGLTRLSARLANSIRGLTGKAEARALKAALAPLTPEWAALPNDARERVLQRAKKALRDNLNREALPRVAETFRIGVKSSYNNSKWRYIGQHKLDIPLTLSSLDKRIAQHIAQSTANFVRDEYGKRSEAFGKKVRAIVARGTKRGAGSREIVADLKEQITDIGKLGRGDHYWEIVSLAFMNRARNYAALSSLQEAGFTVVVWESTLDEVTTETCRFLHGKTFPVDGVLQKFEQAEQAQNPEDLKQIQPWISQGVNNEGKPALFARGREGEKIFIADILKPGVGVSDRVGTYNQRMSDAALIGNGFSMPPIHGLCRSILLPDTIDAPRTIVVATPPPAPPRLPAKPRKPKGAKSAPKPKKPELASKGYHFDNFISDLPKDLEGEMLASFDDVGGLEFLRKNPIGRIVFTNKTSSKDMRHLPDIGKGANGVYHYELSKKLADGSLQKARVAVLKVKSKPTPQEAFKLTKDGPAPWSMSTSMKGRKDRIKTTLIHEFAHHVHLHDGTVIDGKPLSEFVLIDSIINEAFNASSAGVKAKRFLPVTRYSEQDPLEFFAESFACHAIAPDILEARNPVAFKMVELVRGLRKLGPVNAERMATIERN